MKRILIIFLMFGAFLLANAQSTLVSDQTAKNSTLQTVDQIVFKPLPFALDALEPSIDKQTVDIHYNKHHKTYFDNFIKAIKGTEMESMSIDSIFRNVSHYPVSVRNNGGGYFNHMLYWENMKAEGSGMPSGSLLAAITKTYNTFDEFKKQFSDAGKSRFGSGWVWLCMDISKNLFICSTPNQDNPLMDLADKKGTPLLVMDVWEHAYYLKYQNKRADYIDAFWNVVNWEEVAKRFQQK